MPVKSEVKKEHHLVVMTITNPVTVDQVMNEYRGVMSRPGFRCGMNSVWDFRGLGLRKIPVGEIRQLIRGLHGFGKERGEGYKSALVMGKMLDYHLINTYSCFIKLVGNVHIRIFKNMDDAQAWLNTPD